MKNNAKLLTWIKGIMFLALFVGLFGVFFNQKEQWEEGIMARLYGTKAMTITGLVFLLLGWTVWEFAVGKRNSRLLAIIAIVMFLVALGLIGHLLALVGIGIATAIAVFIMIVWLESKHSYIGVLMPKFSRNKPKQSKDPIVVKSKKTAKTTKKD